VAKVVEFMIGIVIIGCGALFLFFSSQYATFMMNIVPKAGAGRLFFVPPFVSKRNESAYFKIIPRLIAAGFFLVALVFIQGSLRRY